jgi:hypothetical protein
VSALYEGFSSSQRGTDRRLLVELQGEAALVAGLDDTAKERLLAGDLLEQAARSVARERWRWLP